MHRRSLVGTGWKMNIVAAEVRHYAAALRAALRGVAHEHVELFVLPPFTSLHAARAAFADSAIGIGGQNMHWQPSGAWTGEISAPMLVEAGCRYVELAHSDRLAHFGETYEQVRLKVDAALAAGLTPILCIGESEEDKRTGQADRTLAGQLRTVLDGRAGDEVASVILAYEPRWAIGKSQAAEPDYVARRLAALRSLLGEAHGDAAAASTRIVYGGSVTPGNGSELIAIADMDGLFIGRAAWTAEGFASMIRIVSDARAGSGRSDERRR